MAQWNLTGPEQDISPDAEPKKWNLSGPDQEPSYLQRTIANIPSSAAKLGHEMLHPEEEIAGIYELGKKIKAKYGQEGAAGVAEAAAKHLYNSIVDLPQTFEKDPVGTTAGAGQLLLGGPEALAAKGVRGLDEAAIAAKTASLPARIANLPVIPKPMSEIERTAALKGEAGAQMNVGKASEEALPTTTMQPIVEDLKAKAKEEGYNPRIHKNAKALFKEFDAMLPQEAEGPDMSAMMARMAPVPRASLEAKLAALPSSEEVPTTTLKKIHELRQQIRSVSKSQDENERKIGYHMKDALDNYMGQFLEGKTLTEGIKRYAAASTAEDIQNLTDRALYRKTNLSAGQKAAALNTELRQWARPTLKGPNPRMRMLRAVSPKAADKMEALATGGSPTDAILRGLGSGHLPEAL